MLTPEQRSQVLWTINNWDDNWQLPILIAQKMMKMLERDLFRPVRPTTTSRRRACEARRRQARRIDADT